MCEEALLAWCLLLSLAGLLSIHLTISCLSVINFERYTSMPRVPMNKDNEQLYCVIVLDAAAYSF